MKDGVTLQRRLSLAGCKPRISPGIWSMFLHTHVGTGVQGFISVSDFSSFTRFVALTLLWFWAVVFIVTMSFVTFSAAGMKNNIMILVNTIKIHIRKKTPAASFTMTVNPSLAMYMLIHLHITQSLWVTSTATYLEFHFIYENAVKYVWKMSAILSQALTGSLISPLLCIYAVLNWVIIGLDNGLSPLSCQAIILNQWWLRNTPRTNFNEKNIKINPV